MARKTHDLVVTVREYQDRDGNTKREYQNIGALMESEKGPFVILERWFNPAGIANPENRSNLMVSCFEPRSRDGQQGGQRQQSQTSGGFDDRGEVPF